MIDLTTGGVWYHPKENVLGTFSAIGLSNKDILGVFAIECASALATPRELLAFGWVWIGDL
jgi:hypothetical protein